MLIMLISCEIQDFCHKLRINCSIKAVKVFKPIVQGHSMKSNDFILWVMSKLLTVFAI